LGEWEGVRRRGKILSKVSWGREVRGCVGGRMDEVEEGGILIQGK